MCTIGRTTVKAAGEAHHRPDAEECTVRREQGRTDCGSKRGRNSFLSTAFIPLAQNNLTVDCYDSGECNSINVITRDNYEFLRDSYFRYSLLLQKEGVHMPGNSIGEGIANLYDEMNTLVGDELHVNIEQEAGRLFFRLWKYHKWGSFTLYYFPVKFLESLNPILRRIAITFIHKLMKANGIDTFVDYEESDFLFEMLSEDDGSDPEEWKERMKLLDSYQEGKIGRLLKRVESKSYYKNLPKALDTYEPQNGFEQPLVDAMKRGLPFLTPARGIMQYAYERYIEMKRVHYIDNYLLNPQHPVTVNLIGAGGTGSQVLTCLARLDVTLRALGHPGLFVTLYDPDIVTDANIGRQLFGCSDLGLNKAQCLITRVNNFFGNDWKAVPDIFPTVLKDARRDDMANITVTCTDNIKSRLDLWNVLKAVPTSNYRDYETPLYWMDFGNTQSTGQVVLGTIPKKIKQPASELYKTVDSLKVITRFVKYARVKEADSGPSCSLAEALEKQDLFINSTLAQLGCNILWKMFRNGMLEHHGLFLNLETMKVNPIMI